MLTEAEILKFIEEDATSEKKRNALVGLRYYEGDHDIKNYKLYYYNADGDLIEDTTRSNIKISHPFFTELVDQEVQYMLSGDCFVKSDLPELQSFLDEYFNDNEDFVSELYEVMIGAVSKGFEYMYAYKNSEGKLAFQCADSMGVIEIESKFSSDKRDYYIYWYIERIDKDRRRVKRIQVWDDEQTWYYTQVEDGKLILDENDPENGKYNPRPHVIYKKDNDDNTYYEGLGYIPFFRLDNCKKQFSGLKPIKSIIDDYYLMSCSLSNNLQDLTEGLVVVKGFAGDNMDELIQNLKTKKAIGVSEEGDIDIRTVEIPYEARKTKMELDETNVYRFGMGFNSAQIGDGNVTNVVIKSRYALLDLKCNKLEIRLKQFLRKILKVVLQEINDEEGTDFQNKDVYFDFRREIMTNALDNAQIEQYDAQTEQVKINTLLGLESTLGNELVVQNICEVLDIDYEKIKSVLPTDDLADAQTVLNGVTVDENVKTDTEVVKSAEEEVGKSLNGAQTQSLLSVIAQYKSGALTVDEAISIISISIGITEERARKLLHVGDAS